MKKIKGKTVVFFSLIVVVFLAIIAWIFSPSGNTITAKKAGGLNTQLPGANVKGDTAKDKLSFYSAASQDSVKRAEQIRMDPNRRDTVAKVAAIISRSKPVYINTDHFENNQLDAKIKSIQRQLSSSKQSDYPTEDTRPAINQNQRVAIQPAPDPEMDAINSTLDKIMAIQNPKSNAVMSNAVNPPGYSVSAGEENDVTYFGKKNNGKPQQDFYGDAAKQNKSVSALTATIVNEQQLASGTTVKLELGSSITVNALRVPAGTAVFGVAAIEGERLRIHIPSIQYQHTILPVSLDVFDMDGLEGIYIPGSVARDVVKESADGAIQSTGVAGLGLSLQTQAAAAGVGLAKNLLSKKVKQVRVTVSSGYRVLLRDNKQDLK